MSGRPKHIKPPRGALRFLRWFCDPQLCEDLEGDLSELFHQRAAGNQMIARALYTRDVLFLFRPGIIRNFELFKNSTTYSMLRNYLKAAWRNMIKYKGFSTINVFSLSIGMAACMVIFLFIRDELSFDGFHNQKDNIYRLCEVQSFPGTNTQKVALTMPGMGPTMTDEFPEVQSYTRFWSWGEQLMEMKEKNFMVDKMAGVDTSFFHIFDFNLLHGNRNALVREPYDAVVTREIAMNVFGKENAIGETFVVDGDMCTVRGVIETVPENSHLQFDVLLSIYATGKVEGEFNTEFRSNYMNTYLVLNDNANPDQMTERFPEYLPRVSGRENINDSYELFLQPLSDVHLSSTDIEHDYNNHRKFNGTYIDVFILVGIFILIIASVNFMNLTTARASNRAKEVGVRKTIGAAKDQLFGQFILESIVLSLMALFFALILVVISLPFLNNLIERDLSLLTILVDLRLVAIMLGATLSLGVLAGLYPSAYLSSFKPVVVLKGIGRSEKKSLFRSSLVVIQFSLALGMIVCTLVVIQQLTFMKNKDIGFNKEHILLVDMNRESAEHYDRIKQELLQKSNVLGVTGSGQRLGNNFHQWGFKALKDTGLVSVTPSNVHVDYDYLDVYGIKLLAGRGFSDEYATDNGLAFVINESFAKELGYDEPIGQKVAHSWYPDDSLGTIIGVTEDFHFNSLHYKVNTLSMVVHEDWGFSEMSVKINGQNVAAAIQDVEDVYMQFVSDFPFEYSFLDDHFEELYKSDQQMGYVITIIAVLSIFIGCMGLFGLASISIRRRIKEIGIRKVMGASTSELMTLLSRSFAWMILISFVVASPLTFLFLSGWLENFAYRVSINPLLFLAGGAMALIIALGTISFHVIKAANANPVQSLRYE